MLGILTLDTAFPRIRGDLGSAETFEFPVRHAIVEGAFVEEIVDRRNAALLRPFIVAARRLVAEGCIGITTTCGFLAAWQVELAQHCEVPLLTSALLQLPLVQATLPAGKRVGVVTYSARDLDGAVLRAANAPVDTPVAGLDPESYFCRTIRRGSATLDRAQMGADTIETARRLVADHHNVGAIVLECANMPPYRDAVAAATGLPVYDAAQLVDWFYAGLHATSHALRTRAKLAIE
ncbi:MAG TPA: aspartate/glutamate racemase family protein [Casimicrobiaceae bacterium]|nr:aspartate/glutamate racemase family protein [Casimicrobiaceae bacterium]